MSKNRVSVGFKLTKRPTECPRIRYESVSKTIRVGDIAIEQHQHKLLRFLGFLYCSEVEPEAENRAAACGLPLTGSGRDDKI